MEDHGYNPAEMPSREAGFVGPLEEPGPVRAARVVDLHPCLRRATAGECVRVRVSIVKPDKREVFARHVREVRAPALRAVQPDVHASARFLEPTAPNADGTWTFVWLADPVAPGEDDELTSLYEAFYGAVQAGELLREWEECHAVEQLVYSLTQTDW